MVNMQVEEKENNKPVNNISANPKPDGINKASRKIQ